MSAKGLKKSASVTKPPGGDPKLQLAVQVARVARVMSVRFTEISAKTDLPGKQSYDPQVTAGVRFTEPEVERQGNEAFVVRLKLLFAMVDRTVESGKAVVNITALTELHYSASDENQRFPDDAIDAFASLNAPFNCWPYWRELVQSVLTRMDLPIATLPLLRLEELPRYRYSAD